MIYCDVQIVSINELISHLFYCGPRRVLARFPLIINCSLDCKQSHERAALVHRIINWTFCNDKTWAHNCTASLYTSCRT
jgi:hypothetical protein